VCLAIEEPTLIQVAEGASFRGLVIYAADADVELSIATEVSPRPTIFLGGYAPSFTAPNRDDIVEYTPQEWLALRLPVDTRFHQAGLGALHTLNAALEVQVSTPLSGNNLAAGALSSWSPVAP
jgi:hypothetical protein